MVKMSIIIPYYKTYELTDKLLENLTNQYTDEIEIILIDDGCNEKRLDKYKLKVKIIHLKKNVGGAEATNKGIDNATGKYIAFVDSDDMVADDYVETLINAINEQNADAIFMDWVDMANGMIVHRPDNYAPWKAIYKKEIIPRFPKNWIYSYDVPFYEELNSKPYTKYYLDKVLYYYNSNRPGNLTSLKAEAIKKGEL